MRIFEASLEMQPSYQMKPDPALFEKNKAVLQDGLQCEIRASINKEVNEGMVVKCSFCGGISEKDGSTLLRCACSACNSSFYCCKVRQTT
jgi:hypothetical protein